ncbi:MAG: hypothetical protein ACI9J3_003736 [Parvicellaceae bacterium]|jgi:hypothetical protein
MKKLILPFVVLLTACGASESNSTSNDSNIVAEVIPTYDYTTATKWVFNKDNSDIGWSRILDQKPTKKKIKLFGAMVDVELGAVKLEMEGNVSMEDAYLQDTNDLFSTGIILFDMATFKFAQEKGEGLFNTQDHPHSTLEFLSFAAMDDTSGNYTSDVKLTIQGHSEEFPIEVSLGEDGEGMNLKGTFDFNTLDFPLREAAKKKDVNKDVITVDMDVNFTLGETSKDSTRTN